MTSTSWSEYLRSAKFRQTLVTITWTFLTSTERAVIIPTLWLYLKLSWSQEVASMYYAASMTIFNISVLLITPLCGYLANAGLRVRIIVLFSNQFEILGNILYLLAPSPVFVLIGRMTSGLGAGCESILFTEMSNSTTEHERTRYILATFIARQFGLLFGPVFTLFIGNILRETRTFSDASYGDKVGSSLSVYNSPGLLMGILWGLHTIFTFFIYPNIDSNDGAEEATLNNTNGCGQYVRDIFFTSTRKKITSNDVIGYTRISVYLKYNIIILLFINAISCYNSMALETNLAPVINSNFAWNEDRISWIYLVGSILLILVCLIMFKVSMYVTDYPLLLFGSWLNSLNYCAIAFLLLTLPLIGNDLGLPLILTGIGVHIIAIPFQLACSESLFTKLIPSTDMHRGQTILRTFENVAYTLGPAIGGAFWHMSYYVFFSMFGLLIVITLLLSCSREYFTIQKEVTSEKYNE